MACQVDLVASIENVGGIDVVVKKKPRDSGIIIHQTDPNGRVQVTLDAAGTYEISIRKPGGIPGVPVGSMVQLSGRAVKTSGVGVPAPVLLPLATGRSKRVGRGESVEATSEE